MTRSLLSSLLLLLSAPTALSSGVFQLKIDSFSSNRSVCRPESQDCGLFFRVCLKHSQDVIDPKPPCTYGLELSDVFRADPESVSASSPIRVALKFKLPDSLSLIIEAWRADSAGHDATENPDNLISRSATRHSLRVGADWTHSKDLGELSELRYSYHVTCDDNYHGESCSAYCRPRNDTFGHYTCDQQGARRCLEGWKGDYCTEPICAPGCSEDHGFCQLPGQCVCRQGWSGELCDRCARHPGCVHGTCQLPWQCNCKEGWGGLYCDQDLNYCTNHKPCQNQAACTNSGQGSYTCTCTPGFSGKDCELEINECDSSPCRNGGSCHDLVNDYTCTCPPGFYGKNCQSSGMTCADKPCFNGGTCQESQSGGYRCHCPPGFTGSNCEKKMDRCASNPCANGAQCRDLGHRVTCRCRPGFTGLHCETNIDDCRANPCLNAGTCVDGINDFTCTCTLGYSGKDCSLRTSPCDLSPCDNGGTCYAHFSGPVCSCPDGFMGARCEYLAETTPATQISVALAAACAIGLATLALLLCAAVFIARQLRRGHRLAASSVKNDLETVNNNCSSKSPWVGGSAPLSGWREKEAFLIPGVVKLSNQTGALGKGEKKCNLTQEQWSAINSSHLNKALPSVLAGPAESRAFASEV
ncbi:delta-like protein C [Synchiropus splendidus]|uniref:delta-like protein C n=1 Tax=Synchiropus splendidus TaxID=270530 RepID=UPI00237E23BF|nr:delta-like protein C [Synchiropus splendidus]